MHRILTVSLALTFGAVLGGAGVKMIATPSASAQTSAPTSGFHAVTLSATQSGSSSLAWFVGQDGSARVCSSGTPARCDKVNF